MNSAKPVIYTIGHSTRNIDEFVEMLQSFQIKLLVDVRRFPGSRKFPDFNSDNLRKVLADSGIKYLHLEELGGRRKVQLNSKNLRWRKDSFRGYADYMETSAFEHAIQNLESVARIENTAIMCAEAVWWRCHRALIADFLKAKNWTVFHIMSKNKVQEHPYTQAARIRNGRLEYFDI